ncbi:MAG: TrkH family potassium uptake protein, partial [Deltaproteobacteria bacterium]|nr:TrkH family potassium uptake protein [Deltaproteobacteria bacterium]
MINHRLIAQLTGWIVLITGCAFLPPLIPAYFYQDGSAIFFWQSLVVSTVLGAFLLAMGSGAGSNEPRYRDSLAIVGISWFLISLIGALPYIFSGRLDFWSAIFESFSGFSSTGATAIKDLGPIPKGLLFWRAFTQWLGGMGIIVLMVAVLPFLGVGGQIMLKNEISGQADKLKPRVAQTAKILWGLYISLTLILTILLFFGGLGFFDSVCQALTTVSTGGFSNYNESAGYHQSLYIRVVILIFMFLGSVSIALYWQALTGHWRALIYNSEVVFLVSLILAVSLISSLALVFSGSIPNLGSAFFQSLFHAVSVVSTSGLMLTDWSQWPHLSQSALFFLFFVGGCSGSTSGGVKVFRWILLIKSVHRACRKLIHPRGVFPVRVGGKIVSDQLLEG